MWEPWPGGKLQKGVRGPASRFIVKASPKRNRLNGGHQCSPGPLARVAEQDARAILAALEQRAHVNSVASSLAVDRNQVEHIVEFLASEGHWSIDDDRHKSASDARRASRETLRV